MSLEDFLKFEERKKMWVVCPEFLDKEVQKFSKKFGKKVWDGMPRDVKRLFFLQRIRPKKRGKTWSLASFSRASLFLDIEVLVEEREGNLVLVWEAFCFMDGRETRVCKSLKVLFWELRIVLKDLEEEGEDVSELELWIDKLEKAMS
nr:hypothetical protein MarFTME_436 [Marseillevirus futianmevirus]